MKITSINKKSEGRNTDLSTNGNVYEYNISKQTLHRYSKK